MSLNRLYNIFKSDRLERADVEAYGQSNDSSVQNAIEQKAMTDSFENDAMEGWEELSYDPSVMANLDKKFMPTKGMSVWKVVGGSTLLVSAVAVVLYVTVFNKESEPVLASNDIVQPTTPPVKMQVIILDESDVSLPAPIEKMEQAPKNEQMPAAQISKEFQEIITFHIETPQIPVDELPIVEPVPAPKPEIVKNHKEAKEIYLHSMKLVDYRKYREKPQVKTKQLLLTGTPASQEGDYTEDEDPVWRDVDVPYIDYLNKSVKIFERGNYKKALSRFETIWKTYPDDINANFYSAICLYNLKEYKQAIQHFANCINGKFSNFDEEATWMIAESYEKLGAITKSKQIYQTISSGNGFYANQAKEKLKKL